MSTVEQAHATLVQATQDVREVAQITKQLESAAQERELVATRHEAHRLRFDVEKDDVEDLEGSMLGIIGRLLSSSKKEDLEREKSEAAAVKLQLDEAEGELAALDKRTKELKKRQSALANSKRELKEASDALQKLVRDGDSELAQQLDRMIEQETNLRVQLREINEARMAGMTADVGLGQIMDSLRDTRSVEITTSLASSALNSVTDVSLVDNLANIKLQSIRQSMGPVRQDLLHFQKECRDIVDGPGSDVAGLEPMAGVMEFIIGDLLGWHILDVIYDASWRVEKTRDTVQLAISNLRGRNNRVEVLLGQAVEQRATLLKHWA
jgi:DNA repair exonuclease SbcCD ATPase subunit